MLKRIVGVLQNPSVERYQALFDALVQLYPIVFRKVSENNYEGLDALIVLDDGLAAGMAAAAGGLPAYVVLEGMAVTEKLAGSEVRFGDSTHLDEYLRRQVMRDEQPDAFSPLKPLPGDEVLASLGEHPLWLNRPASCGNCQVVALSPPAMRSGEFVFRYLNAPGFMRLLPLLNFLRHLVKGVDWEDAPTRACFVFDDCSLYRPTYGFLNYRLLAEHAIQHNYYVSVAMVPLDTWFVSRTVAKTLHACSPRISLLVHGNNHTSYELLLNDNSAGKLALVAQAMRRMHRLELRHQTPFLRIMEAPHAVISYEMFEHLLAIGFEAAICTTEKLVHHNPNISWPATIGMGRGELLGGGLLVIPRIRMSSLWKNEVLIAAFLRQPILLAGHHRDARDNLGLLADFASLVNSFKSVTWGSPMEMARSNYKYMREGKVLNVKAYSRRFQVHIPEGVESFCVHRPWLVNGTAGETIIVNSGGREIFRSNGFDALRAIPFVGPGIIEICCPPTKMIDCQTVDAPKFRLWPILRKILMEMRDRLGPFIVDRRTSAPVKKGS